MATDKPFTIWHSDNAVLIRFASGESVELANEDATALAAALVPAVPTQNRVYMRWTEERAELLRRLYVDERLGISEIARRLDIKPAAADARRRKLGIPVQSPDRAARGRENMRRLHARRSAA